MRLSLLPTALLFAVCANAQYFSEGWKPGKPVTSATSTSSSAGFTPGANSQSSAESTPSEPFSLQSLLDVRTLLNWKPIKDALTNAGINATETYENAIKIWNPDVPLITDHNYEDLIVNEKLTDKEEKDRVWFLIITTASNGREGTSKAADGVFDEAFKQTQAAGDLKHVRFGRIDYMNVTALTTRWFVWNAPYLVVLKDRGQTLRFYKTTNLRMKPELMRKFLANDGWIDTQPWTSILGPGGEWEFVMNHFSISMMNFHHFLSRFPNWVLYMVTGGLGTLLLSFMHGSPKKPEEKKTGAPAAAPAPTSGTPKATAATGKSNGGKKRAGKK